MGWGIICSPARIHALLAVSSLTNNWIRILSNQAICLTIFSSLIWFWMSSLAKHQILLNGISLFIGFGKLLMQKSLGVCLIMLHRGLSWISHDTVYQVRTISDLARFGIVNDLQQQCFISYQTTSDLLQIHPQTWYVMDFLAAASSFFN